MAHRAMDPISQVITSVASTTSRPAPAAKSVGTEFETLVLTNLIETMLPKGDAIYGGGAGADVWRSQLAQTIAAQLAHAETIGIAKTLDLPS
ncbi:MAG: rod-binding protein [Pseudomonadota bacterium]